jgi:H+/Cl- antiporter ClcA
MFVTSCWTYGLFIPSGLFVPSLATGAAYGRIVGQLVHTFKPSANVGVYALVGAASFLGGVVRMTISLTVIMVEATDNVIFSFPIMLALLCAKWVGDHFNVGIYDIHIHLKKIPMLEESAENIARRLLVNDVMTSNVVCVPAVIRVSSLVAILEESSHNGFPVVEE